MSDISDIILGQAPQKIVDDNTVSGLCRGPLTAMTVSGIVEWVLKYHFAEASHLPDALREVVYRTDPTTTGVCIQQLGLENWQAINMRPAIIVSPGACQLLQLGLSNGMAMGSTQPVSTQGTHHEFGAQGAINVFCCSTKLQQAHNLAWETVGQIQAFADKIASDMRLQMIRVVSVDKAAMLEEADEYWAVPVSLAFGFHEAWRQVPAGAILKGLSLTV